MTYGFADESARLFPGMVMFDVTNVCNAECVHCAQPIIKKRPDYRATNLSEEHHRTVIDEVRAYPSTVLRYTADGEPLLHPKIVDMLAYTKRTSSNHASLTTNGELLDEARASRLLDSGVDVIDISLDAGDRETFESIRRKLHFDRIVANVRRLIELRNARRAPTKVMLSIVKQPSVEASLPAFIAEWEAIADKVLVRELHTNVGLTFGKPSRRLERHPCAYLWNRVVVAANGALKFCPIDWLHATDVHRVGETTIADLWQGPIYEALRAGHLTGNFEDPRLAACAPCDDWRITPWQHGYDAVVKDVAAGRKG